MGDPIGDPVQPNNISKQSRFYKCNICDRNFRSIYGLSGHCKVHSNRPRASQSKTQARVLSPKPLNVVHPTYSHQIPWVALSVTNNLSLGQIGTSNIIDAPPGFPVRQTSHEIRTQEPERLLILHNVTKPPMPITRQAGQIQVSNEILNDGASNPHFQPMGQSSLVGKPGAHLIRKYIGDGSFFNVTSKPRFDKEIEDKGYMFTTPDSESTLPCSSKKIKEEF